MFQFTCVIVRNSNKKLEFPCWILKCCVLTLIIWVVIAAGAICTAGLLTVAACQTHALSPLVDSWIPGRLGSFFAHATLLPPGRRGVGSGPNAISTHRYKFRFCYSKKKKVENLSHLSKYPLTSYKLFMPFHSLRLVVSGANDCNKKIPTERPWKSVPGNDLFSFVIFLAYYKKCTLYNSVIAWKI